MIIQLSRPRCVEDRRGPLAAVLLARRRRGGGVLAAAVLVSDSAANGVANYALDSAGGVTVGRARSRASGSGHAR